MNDHPDGPHGDVPTPPAPSGAPTPPPYVPTVGAGAPGDDRTDVMPGHGYDAPTESQATVPQPPVPPPPGPPSFIPPVAPPPFGQAAPGYPAGPPMAPPGAPLGSAPPPTGPPVAPPAPPSSSGSRNVVLIVLVVAAVTVLLGIIAVAGLATVGSGSLAVTIDTCEIGADGELTASGTIEGVSNGDSVDLTVEFVDVDTDESVDTVSTGIDVSFVGVTGEAWEVTGNAGDEVQQVRCDVEAST